MLADLDLEYRVAPGRLLVLDGRKHLPAVKPVEQVDVGLLDGGRSVLAKALDVHSPQLVLFHLVGELLLKT